MPKLPKLPTVQSLNSSWGKGSSVKNDGDAGFPAPKMPKGIKTSSKDDSPFGQLRSSSSKIFGKNNLTSKKLTIKPMKKYFGK